MIVIEQIMKWLWDSWFIIKLEDFLVSATNYIWRKRRSNSQKKK